MERAVKHWTRTFPTSLIPCCVMLRCWDAPEGPHRVCWCLITLWQYDHPVPGAGGNLFRFSSEVKSEDGHQNEKELVWEFKSVLQINIFSTSFEGRCPIEREMLRNKGIWVAWKSLPKGNITQSTVCWWWGENPGHDSAEDVLVLLFVTEGEVWG